jgi:hypothetical protein
MTGRSAAPPADHGLLDLRERKRLLDGVFVLTVALAFTAVAVSWFLRLFDLDLTRAARGAFLLALGYAAAAVAADLLRGRHGLAVALTLLQVGGIVGLALLWHLVGGVENPMFLLAFFLPVGAGAILLSGWQPLVLALVSVASAAAVALAESAGLRFDVVQLAPPVQWLIRILPTTSSVIVAGPGTPPAAQLVALGAFAALQLGFVLLTQALAGFSLTLQARTPAAVSALDEGDPLFGAVAKASLAPTAVVFADSAQVVRCSDSFRERMLLHGEDLAGRNLFELARFAEPEKVRALLVTGGELPFCFYDVGREPRVARLRVDAVSHRGTRYANVVLHDLIDLFYLKAALDGTEEPLMLIGKDERLRYFNRAASRLLGELYFGQEAVGVLGPVLGGAWRGARPRGTSRVEIRGRPYSAIAVEVRTPEQGEVVTILRLLPEEAA